ncbi:hypothetical protein CPB97_001189 [Podila verticillata]|nr:hypothetical protein CPB97_001189 [Podila verticillata]
MKAKTDELEEYTKEAVINSDSDDVPTMYWKAQCTVSDKHKCRISSGYRPPSLSSAEIKCRRRMSSEYGPTLPSSAEVKC